MEKKVLLIDDEDSLRRSVAIGLMQKGYQTEPCENGMKALQTLERFRRNKMPLDYAIVDVRLPDIDGIKLLKVIKFNYPELPVIVITGFGGDAIAEEVKTEKADGYLEKPFSMEDLAKMLEEMPAIKVKATEETTTLSAAPAQSVSAYALVSLDPSADLLKAYRKLYFQERVVYCDAIRGEHDLVMLFQGATQNDINATIEEQIKTVEGVAEVTLLPVDAPVFGENVVEIMGAVDKALGRDKDEDEAYTNQASQIRASSYVLMEIEKEKLDTIYPALYFNDQVVYCDCTRGKYDIVMLMKGSSFSQIESAIRNKFKSLDGVLRIKEWPIITLFDL
jgi:CheY-like chemotaxis protein